MKRTKKLDAIVLNSVIDQILQDMEKSVGLLSTLTLKLLVKRLNQELKSGNFRPKEPSWMKQDHYYETQRLLIEAHVSREAIKRLGKG